MNLHICYFILQCIIVWLLLIFLFISNNINVLIILFFIIVFIKLLNNIFGYFILSPLKNNKCGFNVSQIIISILTKKKMNDKNVEKMIINIALCILFIKISLLLFISQHKSHIEGMGIYMDSLLRIMNI
jgi:hypothetical protein